MIFIKQNPWLVLSLLQTISVVRIARLYRKQTAEYKRLHNITVYLVDMLEKNEVMCSEFDMFALRELGVSITVREEI
jgi:hypothetical protein